MSSNPMKVSFWFSMREKKFPGEVRDILEGPEYKVHLNQNEMSRTTP